MVRPERDRQSALEARFGLRLGSGGTVGCRSWVQGWSRSSARAVGLRRPRLRARRLRRNRLGRSGSASAADAVAWPRPWASPRTDFALAGPQPSPWPWPGPLRPSTGSAHLTAGSGLGFRLSVGHRLEGGSAAWRRRRSWMALGLLGGPTARSLLDVDSSRDRSAAATGRLGTGSGSGSGFDLGDRLDLGDRRQLASSSKSSSSASTSTASTSASGGLCASAFRSCLWTFLPPWCSPHLRGLRGRARARPRAQGQTALDGASIIVMLRPSCSGFCSTTA